MSFLKEPQWGKGPLALEMKLMIEEPIAKESFKIRRTQFTSRKNPLAHQGSQSLKGIHKVEATCRSRQTTVGRAGLVKGAHFGNGLLDPFLRSSLQGEEVEHGQDQYSVSDHFPPSCTNLPADLVLQLLVNSVE
jgi:dTDP-4-dehydrorhamnose reductase